LTFEAIAAISTSQESFACHGQYVLLLPKKIILATDPDKEAIVDVNQLED